MYYGGCDPGKKGAIAILTERAGFFDVLCLVDIPMAKDWYDVHAIYRLFNSKLMILGLEESYRFPKLCKGIGILWACAKLAPNVRKLTMVRPQQWQKYHKIKKADKNVSIDIARHLFPDQARMLTQKQHHNRAEALLIATYIRSEYCPTKE